MTIEQGSLLVIAIICILLFVFVIRMNIKEAATQQKAALLRAADEKMHGIKYGYFSYDRIEDMLWRKGAVNMFGATATPVNYIILKILIFIGVVFFGTISAPFEIGRLLICIACGVAATFVPDVFLSISDDDDNKQMLEDIKSMYDTLRIETHAGIYLTQALSECYMVVRNKRLKAALLDVTNEIIAHNDIGNSLVDFQRKFDNQYIDMFVITIRQSLDSGRSVEILQDVSKELEEVQRAINMGVQEALDRKLQLMQLLLFVGMMGIILYSMVSSLMGALTFG